MDLFLTSSLEKVFPDTRPSEGPESLSALRGETVSFQVAYRFQGTGIAYADIAAENCQIREVVSAPCRYPAHARRDDKYLRTEPGLFPDLLRPLPANLVRLVPGQWRSLWITYSVAEDHPAGDFPLRVALTNHETQEEMGALTFHLRILDALLPPQKLLRTEWMHADCLADYYHVEVFSPEHWSILENFIGAAAQSGINMILTPHFTPPLDTAPGHERTTVQLVDVAVCDGEYHFAFDRLEKWIRLCQRCGITHFEMSHLFTQWGAERAPKIMATVEGSMQQLFGWNTLAISEEYRGFLAAYLPALTAKLREWGIAERTLFHISDEPEAAQLPSYMAARDIIRPYLEGFKLMDALSDYTFYEKGATDIPVCAVDHVQPFLDNDVRNLWTYYCTGQSVDVTNRFFSMPSARTRIYGLQLFKFRIQGALHWGYNFYNSHLSLYPIDPFFTTDSGDAFPGGDPFLVYPGPDGQPLASIRMMVMAEAMQDLRACELLAAKKGRDYVIALIEQDLKKPLTFTEYPTDIEYLPALRERINAEIAGLR